MSATQAKMERETMYKWKKAYEEEAQCHAATAINLQKIVNAFEAENTKLREALVEISQETRVIEGVECSTNGAMIAAETLKELEEK